MVITLNNICNNHSRHWSGKFQILIQRNKAIVHLYRLLITYFYKCVIMLFDNSILRGGKKERKCTKLKINIQFCSNIVLHDIINL